MARKPIYEWDIEELASELKKGAKSQIIARAAREKASEGQLRILNNKLDLADKRIRTSLAWEERLQYVIFPFGITSSFSPNIDTSAYLKMEYQKKYKDFILFSCIGLIFYAMLVIVAGLLLT